MIIQIWGNLRILNKKIKMVLFIISVLTIIVAFCLLIPPKVLTKENNKGNEYKQLDRLMNTTRYAEQVRKAGYKVDDYDLQMMDRIPKLETLRENKFIIISPTKSSLEIFDKNYNIYIEFDKDMNINGGIIKEDKDDSSRKLTEEEKTKYEKEIKQEINKLLDDVYNKR